MKGCKCVGAVGLGEILAGEEGMARQVPALKKVDSRARGIADSMEAAPVFEMPSRCVAAKLCRACCT